MINKNIKIHTPSLIIDKKCLLKNIKTMSKYSTANNINIRPHAKSHKISNIAKLQLENGAIGICVATLYEAEVMVKNKIKGVLLTTPITNKLMLRLVSANTTQCQHWSVPTLVGANISRCQH